MYHLIELRALEINWKLNMESRYIIVKFEDGMYGIRKPSLFSVYEYRSLYYSMWISNENSSFHTCKMTKKEAEKEYNSLMDMGKEVMIMERTEY